MLRFWGSGSLAHLKLNGYMVPWTPCWPIHLLTHICLSFLYLGSVGKQPGSQRPPQLPTQHPDFVLRFRGSSSLVAHLKSSGYMELSWTPCWPLHLLTHICLSFLYLGTVGKQPGSQRPPQLPPQHPDFVLRFRGSSSLAHLKLNGYTVPWTPCWPIHLLTHICLSFLYLGTV